MIIEVYPSSYVSCTNAVPYVSHTFKKRRITFLTHRAGGLGAKNSFTLIEFFFCKPLCLLFPGFVCQNRFLLRRLSFEVFLFELLGSFFSEAFSPTNKMFSFAVTKLNFGSYLVAETISPIVLSFH